MSIAASPPLVKSRFGGQWVRKTTSPTPFVRRKAWTRAWLSPAENNAERLFWETCKQLPHCVPICDTLLGTFCDWHKKKKSLHIWGRIKKWVVPVLLFFGRYLCLLLDKNQFYTSTPLGPWQNHTPSFLDPHTPYLGNSTFIYPLMSPLS